jgi:hypothetical protein
MVIEWVSIITAPPSFPETTCRMASDRVASSKTRNDSARDSEQDGIKWWTRSYIASLKSGIELLKEMLQGFLTEAKRQKKMKRMMGT